MASSTTGSSSDSSENVVWALTIAISINLSTLSYKTQFSLLLQDLSSDKNSRHWTLYLTRSKVKHILLFEFMIIVSSNSCI